MSLPSRTFAGPVCIAQNTMRVCRPAHAASCRPRCNMCGGAACQPEWQSRYNECTGGHGMQPVLPSVGTQALRPALLMISCRWHAGRYDAYTCCWMHCLRPSACTHARIHAAIRLYRPAKNLAVYGLHAKRHVLPRRVPCVQCFRSPRTHPLAITVTCKCIVGRPFLNSVIPVLQHAN